MQGTEDERASANLTLDHVTQTYRDRSGQALTAIADITCDFPAGSLTALIGPSGTGKTTLLNVIAGLDTPQSGAIWLGGVRTEAGQRLGKIGLMPQRDLLLPWRTSLANACAGLEMHGVPRREARARAMDLFTRFGLARFADAYPYTLSGGMRQRVALIRSALAAGPILLLDEPFGALDAITRIDLYAWLIELWQAVDKTILLVTHDITEALILAQRILVLGGHPGKLIATMSNDFAYPRSLAIQETPAFAALRRQLFACLEVAPHDISL